MDCAKIGQLIYALRREKGLTQRQVADALHISAKTVSKWECGRGCPDVTLWDGLAGLLGADVMKLLQGELRPNRLDAGKIRDLRFYVCPSCRNLLTSTGKASLSCCGRRLQPLAPAEAEGEHVATAEYTGEDYYITFDHPMEKEHFLLFAAYVCADRVFTVRLYPEQSAAFSLPTMRSDGTLYVYCTRHGLQKLTLKKVLSAR